MMGEHHRIRPILTPDRLSTCCTISLIPWGQQVGPWGRGLRAAFDCYLHDDVLCALALYAQVKHGALLGCREHAARTAHGETLRTTPIAVSTPPEKVTLQRLLPNRRNPRYP